MEYDWNHTASVVAQIANTFRDPDSDPVSPEDIHPMLRRREKFRPTVPIGILKEVFIERGLY